MKVVCVCAPADGHFRPLLPIAHASVLRLLNEAHFRSASRAAEEDIALMPDPSLVVGRLEALGGVGRLNPRTERSPSPVEGAALEMP